MLYCKSSIIVKLCLNILVVLKYIISMNSGLYCDLKSIMPYIVHNSNLLIAVPSTMKSMKLTQGIRRVYDEVEDLSLDVPNAFHLLEDICKMFFDNKVMEAGLYSEVPSSRSVFAIRCLFHCIN